MTLTTHLYIYEPFDPEKIFGLGRAAVGITPDTPFEIERPQYFWEPPNVTFMRSRMSMGFRSIFWMGVCMDGKVEHPDSACSRKKYDESCVCEKGTPGLNWFGEIMLDTPYGADPCCACTHRDIIATFLESSGIEHFAWNNEFTDYWWKISPNRSCPGHGGPI